MRVAGRPGAKVCKACGSCPSLTETSSIVEVMPLLLGEDVGCGSKLRG